MFDRDLGGTGVTAAVSETRIAHRTHVARPSGPWRPQGPGRPPGGHPRHRAATGSPCPAVAPTSASCPAPPDRRRARLQRRRVVLGTAVAGILVALALPWGGAGSHTLAAPGPVLAGATVAHHAVYVVQPGDTLWTIAERLDPNGDPRSVVSELQAQVGSETVQPGERLLLP